MKSTIQHIFGTTIGQFIGYLAAFFSPISVILITLQIMVWAQWITGWAAASKNGETARIQSFATTLIKMGMYVFILLILRVCEIDIFKDIPISKILGGFWCIRELKVNLDNFSVIVGFDIWAEIMKVVNKIKI